MASKRRIRRNACVGKTRHTSAKNAGYQLGAMRRSGKDTMQMRAYKCKFCNGWHVGHYSGEGYGKK